MVADLLEPDKAGQNETATSDARGFVDLTKHVLDHRVVEPCLFGGEWDVLSTLEQRRKIVRDAVVRLEPSEDERR